MEEHHFSLKALINAKDFVKLALVKAGADAMCATDEIKKRFEIQARELFRMFKYIGKTKFQKKHIAIRMQSVRYMISCKRNVKMRIIRH